MMNGSKSVVVSENGMMPVLNGANLINVKPVTQRIDFTTEKKTGISWNDGNSIVTISHSMNCIPIIVVFDALTNTQIFPTVQILGASSISLDFSTSVSGSYFCILSYGSEYGTSAALQSTLATYVEQVSSAADDAEDAKTSAQQAAASILGHTLKTVTDMNSTSITVNTVETNCTYNYGTLTSLTIVSIEDSGYETTFQFTSGDTACTLSLPDTVNDDLVSAPEANKKFILSIKNLIAVSTNVEA